MPFMPLYRHRLRRTAWVMLFAWVFALLAGVVNACQLQTPDRHATGVTLGESAGHTVDAAQAGCLKFCDDESSAAASGKTVQADLPGPVAVGASNWPLALHPGPSALMRADAPAATQGPPLVIRLLRLTI